MNAIKFSIRRPITIICIFVISLIFGSLVYEKLGIDMFPDVSFPVVSVTTIYPGAGPKEIEQLVTKPMEKALFTLAGVSSIKSINKDSISKIIVKFTLNSDTKIVERLVKDRITTIREDLPKEIKEPKIKNIDPSARAILILSVTADIEDKDLYDLAETEIKPLIEQVKQVGYTEIIGGQKKEIHIDLDRKKLEKYQISATQIIHALSFAGKNIPAGKIESENTEIIVRTVGEFRSIDSIKNTIISFFGNENPVKISDVAKVYEGLQDIQSKHYTNGKPSLAFKVFKKSKSNTLQVTSDLKKRIKKINTSFAKKFKNFKINVDQDGSRPIRDNVKDVKETIAIGILLVIIVVFMFLGSVRSTIITGIAIPNSILGSFIFMYIAGFSINIMTLLAMSLAIGLLIDDAIVVRENIFRHMHMGKSAIKAALDGTMEVKSAVLGTSLTILSVFAPIAFVDGIIGQFFKEFGLTVCFIIIISTIDALFVAPMLSTYLAVKKVNRHPNFLMKFVKKFTHLQKNIENHYKNILHLILRYRKTTLLICFSIAIGAIFCISSITKTFLPPQEIGEFTISLNLKSGTPFNKMDEVAKKFDTVVRKIPEVEKTVVTVGGDNSEPNEADIFVKLVHKKNRIKNTSEIKNLIRQKIIINYQFANPKILDVGGPNRGEQPFQISVFGNDIVNITDTAKKLLNKLKQSKNLADVSISNLGAKPELHVKILKNYNNKFGVQTDTIGKELRYLIEGAVPAVYKENGNEYDILVRLESKDRNLSKNFNKILIPNLNNRLITLSDMAIPQKALGPAVIYRKDRNRYVQVSADISPNGKGLGAAILEVKELFNSGKIKLPKDVQYEFEGSAEDFQDFIKNITLAVFLAIILMFFVLSSLYESFIIPITIMLVIPLATCGAIYALAITNSSIDVFSIIGCILLLGIAAKNSIIQVDYIEILRKNTHKINDAIITACTIRLRPILMTALTIIAGMIPLAVGLNEASSQRTSMGISVIGGTITSTLLTLFVTPAAYTYVQRFGIFVNMLTSKFINKPDDEELKKLTN